MIILALVLSTFQAGAFLLPNTEEDDIDLYPFPYPGVGQQPPPPGELPSEEITYNQFLEPLYPKDHSGRQDVSGEIEDWILEITEPMVEGYITDLEDFGPRVSGSTACYDAGDYIYDEFENLGLTARYHYWETGSLDGNNIEGTLYGEDTTSDEIYVVCGHYDSVSGSPGADDNGAGTAAVLAAANVLSQHELEHTVRFVAFSGEEQGLIGSGFYADEAYDNGDNIVATLNADMIGYAENPDDASKLELYTNSDSQWIVDFTSNVASVYDSIIGLDIINEGYASNSDHYSFWQQGYDAVMYHEYHFNPYYHSPDDTSDKMDMDYDMRVTRLILGTLAELATPIVLNADFTHSPAYPNPGDTISFTDDSAGNVISWSWDFGDGTTSNLQNPTHVYTAENEYDVQLTVYDDQGESETTIKTVGVWNNWAPVSIPNPDFYAGNNPEVCFNGVDSWDPDGSIASYHWDFDDGSTSDQMSVCHTYLEDGIYNVSLTVTDNGGKQGTAEAEIRIDAYTPPVTDINISGVEGDQGWLRSNAVIKFDASDWSGVGKTMFRVDGASWKEYEKAHHIYSNGEHEIEFYSVDIWGNEEEVKTASCNIDSEMPSLDVTVDGDLINGFYASDVVFTCDGSDDVSGVMDIRILVVGEMDDWMVYDEPFVLSEDGSYQVRVMIRDNAGNSVSDVWSIDIDRSAPITTCVLHGDQQPDGWYDGLVSVDFNVEDVAGVATTLYRIDGGDFKEFNDPVNVSARGYHNVEFYSIDILDNQEEVKTYGFNIGVPPEDPVIDGPRSGKAGVEYDFEISSVHEEGGILEFFVDWGDGTDSGWIGGVESGEIVSASHIWETKDQFIVRVKARDQWGGESDWTTLEVSMPYVQNPIIDTINAFLEWLYSLFPFLENIGFNFV